MPKTIRNKFDENLTYEKLMLAHKKSRKCKTTRENVIRFNMKKEEYIEYLYYSLKTQKYKHGPYKTFYVKEPKLRMIEASKYVDRIVHRWYVDNFLIPYFVPTFITNSYACLKNKGMHLSAIMVQKSMRRAKKEWGEYYILKMDVKKYFQNINKKILYNIINRKIKDKKLLWLTKEILDSRKGEKGIPIGNYSSQIYANIYLNEIDQYIKRVLKVKYYVRYMDDSVILYKDKAELKVILQKITKFLKENLELELNSKTNIFKSKQRVNFCGYDISEDRLKIRRKGKVKLKRKIKKLKSKIKTGEMTSVEAKRYLCGHWGYLKYANVHNLCGSLFELNKE